MASRQVDQGNADGQGNLGGARGRAGSQRGQQGNSSNRGFTSVDPERQRQTAPGGAGAAQDPLAGGHPSDPHAAASGSKDGRASPR